MIPKIIHYCWFGRNPKPKLAEKCIRSWKHYCKEYEIIEWNEDNFDISKASLYVRQAYEAKKWAFVTDYVRLWAMVRYGGFYLDTDTEIVRPLDDILQYEAILGFEGDEYIQAGFMACQKDFELFKELLQEYDDLAFIREDGSFDLTTIVIRITNACNKYGFVPNGKMQTIAGFTIFPKDYFCPMEYSTRKIRRTKNTYAIHHYASSWFSEERRKQERINRLMIKFSPAIGAVIGASKKILGEKNYERLKNIMKRKSGRGEKH